MTLTHKGRYWQVSGLEKQVGLRAIIYIRAPAGECSKGRFRALFGGARRSETRTPVSDAPSPPVPFILTPPEGRAASPVIVAGLRRGCCSAITRRNRAPGPGDGPRAACSMQR